ncbi:hypothetical protein CK203_022215 [Vitis vinifera]|uniref:Uncharacterized protein n=1 Tax=Vitis vinifera TaxID=29760 RepID=A0A438FZY6_VITVI|nr:hypothetical protein CK203_022215 [Vitis vinifera]
MEKIKSLPTIPFSDPHNSMAQVPTVDFSLITTGTPDQRSKVIPTPRPCMSRMGIFCGFNDHLEYLQLGNKSQHAKDADGRDVESREFLKVHAHPHFHAPDKPADIGEITKAYYKIAREVAGELLKGISKAWDWKRAT